MTPERMAGREAQPAEAARGGTPPGHLESAPSVRVEAREEFLALKSGAVFVCARPDGDIRATEVSGEGLYARDTRHLSRLQVTMGGLAPVLLSATMESGHDPRAIASVVEVELAADFADVFEVRGVGRRTRGRLTVERPTLPDWLGSIEIRDIRLADAHASLAFQRTAAGATGFSLLEQDGDVRVTKSA
jgi:hypothetical protein